MVTAIDILKSVVQKTDEVLRDKFGKDISFIRFESGYTATVVNAITNLMQGSYDPYPLIAVFTEGLKESYTDYLVEFTAPKIIIVVRAVPNLTEEQRIETNFRDFLYPIFEEFEKQLQNIHHGYELKLKRSDVPHYSESANNANTFNDIVDGIIIKPFTMKVLNDIEC